jgi:hypothetical protein
MLAYLQLPIRFDAQRMQQEVTALAQQHWNMHYNKRHYKGDWSIVALHAVDGQPANIYSIHNTADKAAIGRYKNTPLLDECTYLKQVLDYFQCEKTTVRLMKLNAGAVILPHHDTDMNIEAGEARLHIPVQTNEEVEFYLQEERIPMLEGECWYLNLSLEHRVSNNGTSDRIHLVIDCIVNDWLLQWFKKPGLHKKEIADNIASASYSKEDKLQIIEALRRMNTNVSNELADKMMSEVEL